MTGNTTKEFARPPTPEDWRRAYPYFAEVRSLKYGGPGRPAIGPGSFFDLLVTSMAQEKRLFPKLRELEWRTEQSQWSDWSDMDTGYSQSSLFYVLTCLQRDLQCLTITVPQNSRTSKSVSSFMSHIKGRVPLLRKLTWSYTGSMHLIQPMFSDFLRGLQCLHTITLPRYCLTSSNFGVLGRLPQLQFIYTDRTVFLKDPDVNDFDIVIDDGMFPFLEALSLDISLHVAAELLQSTFFPSTIYNLVILSLALETPENIHHLFSCLSMHCPRMKLLILYLAIPLDDDEDPPAQPTGDITLETLLPLLDLKELQNFTLCYNGVLRLTDDDVERLTLAWPCLATCYLNEEPDIFSDTATSLTLACLMSFATHCPYIEEVGLFLDATHIPVPIMHNAFRFQYLTGLHVGLSFIEDVSEVALWLSDLTRDTEMNISAPMRAEFLPPSPLSSHRKKRIKQWSMVNEQLRGLRRLRRQERELEAHLREKLRSLEEEVAVLRNQ